MRSSKNDSENWSGQNRTSRTACYGHDLGVEVDNELSWKPHIHNLHHQCMGKLAQIRKSCYHLPCKARKLLYLTFVLPQLDYCSVVWGSCGTVLSNKIERIQNYAMRVILRKPPLTPSEESRKTL